MQISKRIIPSWFDVPSAGDGVSFLLAPLTSAQAINVQQEGDSRAGDGFIMAIQYAVRDWRGIVDENGAPLKFTAKSRDLLFNGDGEEIPGNPLLATAVGVEIVKRSRMTETDAKN